MEKNTLFYGDNLKVLREHIPDASVDLIYLDPPFNTGRRRQQGAATYPDHWRWDEGAEESLRVLVGGEPAPLAQTMKALVQILGRRDMAAYLVMLAPRLLELHRVLKPTGSLYLHCDPRASPHLRLLLDAIFGRAGFRNEIIWHYTGGGRSKRYYSRKHDRILFYVKSSRYTFNLDAIREPYKETSGYAKAGITSAAGKRYRPHPEGTPPDDVWDLPIINPLSKERLGYPSQKPLALLERIIKASSNEGDLVLDSFCGSGTTLVVAERLGRRWLGIDSSSAAISLTQERLAAELSAPPYQLIKEG